MMREMGKIDKSRGRKSSKARSGEDHRIFEGKKVIDCREMGNKRGMVQNEVSELGFDHIGPYK